MKVSDILSAKGRDVVVIEPTANLHIAAKLLASRKIGAILILGAGNRIAGILSERDIVRAIAKDGAAVIDRTVSTVMTREVVCVTPEDDIGQVMSVMTERRFRHLPVKRGDKLIGMVSIGDVVKQRVEEAEGEAQQLREYIAS